MPLKNNFLRSWRPGRLLKACWIELQCGLGNRWFSENLHMGSIFSISKAVVAETKQANRRLKLWRKLDTPKSKA